MESGLVRIIESSCVKGSGDKAISHVATCPPYGRYYFDTRDAKAMMEYYCTRLSTWDRLDGKEPESDYTVMNRRFISGLAEMPREYSMLTADIDILGEGTEPVPLHTEEDVKAFVKAFHVAIDENFVEDHANLKMCVVTTKPPYMKRRGVVSHGIHLYFPNIFMSRVSRDTYLLHTVKRVVSELRPLQGIVDDPVECLDYQSGASDRAWMMYGSRKSPKSDAYVVDYVLNEALERIDPVEPFLGTTIVDELENKINLDTRESVIYNFPRILSVNPNGRRIPRMRPKSAEEITQLVGPTPEDEEQPYDYGDEKSDSETHQEVARLVDMIDAEYACGYKTWMEIGWAIHRCTHGSEEGLGIWLEFSQLANELFDEARCVAEWRKCKGYAYTIRTLKYYARISSPDEYAAYIGASAQSRIKTVLDNVQVSGTHYDLAMTLYEAYGDTFVCVRGERTVKWYHFTEHHWKETPKGGDLQRLICPYLRKQFSEYRDIIYAELQAVPPDNRRLKKDAEDRMNFLSKLWTSVGSDATQRSIMNQAALIFHRDDWVSKLGQNPKLICCLNGVIDFDTCTIRSGRPEDNLCLQMPVNYREFDDSNPWMTELKRFLLRVFPNHAIRRYMLELVAGTLIGGNTRKVGPFWTGPRGNNAKSTWVKMLEGVFGPYLRKIPTTLITGTKAAAGKPIPELDGIGLGVRILLGDEANAKKEVINTGQYKIWTGNDSQYWRGLYESGGTNNNLATLVFVLNQLLKFDNPHDEAAWNRVRVCDFEAVFSRDAPEDHEEQMKRKIFPDDPEFSSKIPNLLEPLFYMLVQTQFTIEHDKAGNPHYKYYEPSEVIEARELYRTSCDIIGQFIRDSIEFVEPNEGHLSVQEFHQEYTHYFRQSLPGQSLPSREEIREYLLYKWEDRWNGSIFLGVRIKQNDFNQENASFHRPLVVNQS